MTIMGTLDINGPITEGRVLINQPRSIWTAHVRYASSGRKADIDLGPFLPDAVMLTSFNANASRKYLT